MKNVLIAIITLYSLGANAQCILNNLVTNTPATCEDGNNFLTIDGVFDMSCSVHDNDCNSEMSATVWYEIEIDNNNANGLCTQVESEGFDPVWSLYYGTTFEDKIPIQESVKPGEPLLPCSNSDNILENKYTVPVIDDLQMVPYKYWLAISAVGPVTNPNFTLTYGSTLSCNACSGTSSVDCDNGDFVAMQDGVVTNGPFCPGSEVTVCIEFTYDATSTGNDWLHGMIPTFGVGWDLEASGLDTQEIGGNWEWFDTDGPCAPYLNGYSLPYVCTYTGPDGRVQMCNIACDPTCQCELGAPLPDGSILPSGWFTNTAGSGAACGLNCSPASFFGISGGNYVEVNVCMDLKVHTFLNQDELELLKDLSIVIQTTSDAVTGCRFDSAPCIVDPPFMSPPWEVDVDEQPLATVTDSTLCVGQSVMLLGDVYQDGDVVSSSPSIVSANNNTLTAHAPGIVDITINNQAYLCGPTQVITLSVFEQYNESGQVTICEGETYEGLSSTGTYSLQLISSEGCDSIVELDLTVEPATILDESPTICEGTTITYNGVEYGETGNYTDTLILVGNCIDTIYNINLTVLEAPTEALTATICEGENYLGYTSSGQYIIVNGASNGCDSILVLDLIVQDTEITTQDISLCEGDEIVINGKTYSHAGIFTDTTYSDINCPIQINTINIDLVSLLTFTLDIDICEGEVFMGFDISGTYSVELPAAEGCDTLITLILEVLPSDHPNCTVATSSHEKLAYDVYPVPATDMLYVRGLHGNISSKIYDLSGRLVQAYYDTKTNGLDISDLPIGIYILAIENLNGTQSSKKFIKL